MKLLLHFVTTAKAKCFLSDNGTSKKNSFPTSKDCMSKSRSAFACVCTEVQEDEAAYIGKIWDYMSFWHAVCAHRTSIVYFKWIWPVRVESSPDWSLWEVCQRFQQDQDFNSSLYMKNISESFDLWGQHIWDASEDTWREESRVDPSTMRTSGCASSFRLCLVSSFIC